MAGISDGLRLVTIGIDGQRPTVAMDLNDGVTYTKARGSFVFTPAAPALQRSVRARRYGGAQTVGVTHDNGSVSWKMYIKGPSVLAATQNAEAFLAAVESTATGRYLEWTPYGSTASYMRIAGPGQWSSEWDPNRWSQTQSLLVTFTLPVFPLVDWAQPFILERFGAVGNTADYTFDSATTADVLVIPDPTVPGTGQLSPVAGAALTVERRARYTVRGYDLLEGQATVNANVGTTLPGYKYGVLLRATSATNYIEVYVDDNGTNSRLRIDVVIAGVRTNRSTTNLAARMISGLFAGTVRGRIEGTSVIAEFFTTTATQVSTPTLTASYTLVSGDAPLNTTPGKSGWSWVPQSTNARLYDFEFRPWTYRLRTLPSTITPLDSIPGSAPAHADVEISHTGGSSAPVSALISWAGRGLAPVGGNGAPFGIFNILSSAFNSATNLTATADANASGGTSRQDTSVSGIENYALNWVFDPATMLFDDFSDYELAIEGWIRLAVASSVVTPTLVFSARPATGTSFGSERFTDEWGNMGRVISGNGWYHWYRLGIITLRADPTSNRNTAMFRLAIASGSGSAGSLFVDALMVNPARARALSPTGKTLDTAYPQFIPSTTATTKVVRSDLSAQVAASAGSPALLKWPDHGLGGSLLEPPPGMTDWFLKLGAQVPDDPAPASANEQLTHSATVQLNITPRSFMLRSA